MSETLSITVNGETRAISAGRTLQDLVQELGIAEKKVAIERNRAIAPRSRWGRIALEEGDALEIVQFVGGG